jgi:hypothetical protein
LVRGAPRTLLTLGRCPTVVRAVRSTARSSGSWILGPRVEVRVSRNWRDGWTSRDARRSGSSRSRCVFVRRAVPGAMPEHTLEGKESQESNDPVSRTPARVKEIGERTLGGSKASKRACRRFTGELGSGERPIAVDVLRHARRRGLAARETVVLAHASVNPQGSTRQRVGAAAKAGRRAHPDRVGGRRTRTRKGAREARESGHGSSRGERSEGKLQERERHGTRPRSPGADVEQDRLSRASTSTLAVRTVEREPTLRTAPVRAWQPSPPRTSREAKPWVKGTPWVDCVQGARSSGEADPVPANAVPRSGELRRRPGAGGCGTKGL